MRRKINIKKVLITGISGSGGSYLAEYIVNNHRKVEVHGISRWHSTASDNLHIIRKHVTVHEADLGDFPSIFSVLKKVKPDAIFHLAAHANVRTSFITPISVLQNNIIGTANLFEAIRLLGNYPIIQLCSTSEVYGQVDPKRVPITEDTPLNPASPYAVSKTAQDLLGGSYFTSYHMPIIRTRMFAYVNPRRADLFASAFAKQVARIEEGLQDKLVHGNLNSVRTFIDVRDAMRAYWEAIMHCKLGEIYNIGGTTTMTVGEFLQRLTAMAKVPIKSVLDKNLLRPSDVTLQIPSVKKFIKATGWKPIYSFEDSMNELLGYWREQVKKEK